MAGSNPIPPLQPGASLQRGRYTIERVLGAGGFGYVYLARDTKLNRQVAIKQCIDLDSETVSQFGHEFAVLKMLAPQSSLFPQVYGDFAEQPPGAALGDPKYVYGVMEFVPGKTLQAVLDERVQRGQGPFGEAEVVGWMLQLLEALERAHSANIIHRDIKPANIMLLPGETEIKVIDVGIAKIGKAGDITQRGAAAASPGFAPPEQYAQAGRTDRGTDIYAVGATMYALLTAAAPLEAPARINQPLPPPRQLNPLLTPLIESVILRAMEMDITRRFPDAAEMRAALQGKSSTLTCPSCSHTNSITALFCRNCGLPFQAVGLVVAGKQVNRPADLPAACDHAWNEGISLLTSGKLRQWLQSLQQVGASALAALTQIGGQYPNDPDLQLDALLRFIQPQRPRPQLRVLPPQPPLVTLEQGDSHTISFTITNVGQGVLAAKITTNESWVTVQPMAVHSMAGEPQVVQVILDSSGLAGTRSGKLYVAAVEVTSNDRTISQVYHVQVTAAPRLVVDSNTVDFGTVQHGQNRIQKTIQVSNDGFGTLTATVQSTASWLQVTPTSLVLATGQRQLLTVQGWSRGAEQPGKQTAEIRIQAGADGEMTVQALVTVVGTFQLGCDSGASLNQIKDLVAWCDDHWKEAVQLLQSGDLYAAARYIGPPAQGPLQRRATQLWPATLSKLQNVTAAQDINLTLETALQALGAAAPEFEHNWPEVESALGLGMMPNVQWLRLKKAPTQVEFRISNRGRGYLHGYLQPLVNWLSIDKPSFSCFPREEERIAIRVNQQARKNHGLRMKLVQLHLD